MLFSVTQASTVTSAIATPTLAVMREDRAEARGTSSRSESKSIETMVREPEIKRLRTQALHYISLNCAL